MTDPMRCPLCKAWWQHKDDCRLDGKDHVYFDPKHPSLSGVDWKKTLDKNHIRTLKENPEVGELDRRYEPRHYKTLNEQARYWDQEPTAAAITYKAVGIIRDTEAAEVLKAVREEIDLRKAPKLAARIDAALTAAAEVGQPIGSPTQSQSRATRPTQIDLARAQIAAAAEVERKDGPTPAQIAAWRDIVVQAMACIRGETPEDVSFGEAEDDTFSKLREVEAEMSAAIRALKEKPCR